MNHRDPLYLRRLLCPRRERPSRSRAADKPDEFPPLHCHSRLGALNPSVGNYQNCRSKRSNVRSGSIVISTLAVCLSHCRFAPLTPATWRNCACNKPTLLCQLLNSEDLCRWMRDCPIPAWNKFSNRFVTTQSIFCIIEGADPLAGEISSRLLMLAVAVALLALSPSCRGRDPDGHVQASQQ